MSIDEGNDPYIMINSKLWHQQKKEKFVVVWLKLTIKSDAKVSCIVFSINDVIN